MEKEIHYLNRLLRGGWGYCSTGSVHWDASNHTCSDSTISHCIWWRALTSRSGAEGHRDVHCASRLAASSLLLKKTHCGYFVAWLDLKAKQLCPLKPHSKSSYLCFYCFSKVPVFCCTLSDRLPRCRGWQGWHRFSRALVWWTVRLSPKIWYWNRYN